jgi:hypothetical protein
MDGRSLLMEIYSHPWLGLSINESFDPWMEDIHESRATYLQHEDSVYI